jgi:hypothetical protein
MVLQTTVWGIIFPIGMVLGLSKSKYHVPVQVAGVGLTLIGSYLGHHHGGRDFPETVRAPRQLPLVSAHEKRRMTN